jgi:hypothetical protein
MSDYYPVKKKRSSAWNYGGEKWKLSRSKIDLFLECQRCFYLDNKLGISRPKFPAFTLNVAVDALLKKEFDIHRTNKTSHPLMDTYGIDAIPFAHKNLEIWRENFEGIQYFHKPTGLLVSGAVDDVWINKKDELIIVDYKATAKDGTIDGLDDTKWHDQYRRQMEVYQWLFRQSGFKVSDTGYFVYVNGQKDRESFDGKLEFDVTIFPYTGSDSWIENVLEKIKTCLESKEIPKSESVCEYCAYIDLVNKEAGQNNSNSLSSSKPTLF